MRSFLASVLLLAFLLGGGFWHSRYVGSVTDRLLSLEESFPAKTAETEAPHPRLQEAEACWQTALPLLSVTVGTASCQAVTAALKTVVRYYECGTESDYREARMLLREALLCLKRNESAGFSGVI